MSGIHDTLISKNKLILLAIIVILILITLPSAGILISKNKSNNVKSLASTKNSNLNSPSKAVLGVSTKGTIKIGVVMVNFKADKSDIKPTEFTKENLSTVYFSDPNSVARYIEKNSLNNLTVKGDINDVYGWITLKNYTRKQVCDIYEKKSANKGFLKAINEKAKAEALSKGKDFSQYDIVGYIFPTVKEEPENSDKTNCFWNAITKGIPGDSIVSPVHFLNGDYDKINDYDHGPLDQAPAIKFYSGILAHEVGHSLGLSHANGIICGKLQISAYKDCSIYNYGNRFDLIGGAWDYHSQTSARNKVLAGWIPETNSKKVNTNGEFTLYSSSKPRTNQTQLIKITRPIDGGTYYLDYRSKTAGDNTMPSYIYEGALLTLSDVNLPPMKNERGNIQDLSRTKESFLIDVDKTDKSGRGGLLNPNFKDNMTFIDKRNKISIKQISHNQDSVKLSINFSPPPCVLANPSVTARENSQSGLAGIKLKYKLTIKNNNSSSCPAKVFNLSAVKPNGWKADFSKNGITINSNQSNNITVSVTSTNTSLNTGNPYAISITVKNSNTNNNAAIELKYNILPPTISVTPNTGPAGGNISPSPKSTPKPTLTPIPTKAASTPTPTPIPANTTILKFTDIKLHGIGKGGDNTNPGSSGNQNPIAKTKLLTVEVYNTSGNLISTSRGNISYANGTYSGTVSLGNTVSTNQYIIKVKADNYLKKQLPGIITINKSIINQAPSVSLTSGDINNDGKLSVLDYNILVGCYSNLSSARNCDAAKKANSDLSSDGKVDLTDFTLFTRELSVINGD